MGIDCGGVVTRVGPACKYKIWPGDLVCVVSPGSMRTIVRSQDKLAASYGQFCPKCKLLCGRYIPRDTLQEVLVGDLMMAWT